MNITITGSAKENAELVDELRHNRTHIQIPIKDEWLHELTPEEMPYHSQAAPASDLIERMTYNNG